MTICPFQGQFVVCMLGLAMIDLHTKFEVSTIICNKDIKGNAKCKNSFCDTIWGLRGCINANFEGNGSHRRLLASDVCYP